MREISLVKTVRLYVVFAAFMLLATGLAKMISAMGDAGILSRSDPVFGLKNRHVMISVGLIELALFAFLVFGKQYILQLTAIFFLSINFVVYRLSALLKGSESPCACLGSLTESIGISTKAADLVAMAVLAYLFIGSAVFLAISKRTKLKESG